MASTATTTKKVPPVVSATPKTAAVPNATATTPCTRTVLQSAHRGVLGSTVSVCVDDYSPSLRRYTVCRRTPHSSPDIAVLGPVLSKWFSLFDVVLLAVCLLLCMPTLLGTSPLGAARGSSSGGGATIAATGLGLDASRSSGSVVTAAGPAGLPIPTGVWHLLASTTPWFVLSRLEALGSLLLQAVPVALREGPLAGPLAAGHQSLPLHERVPAAFFYTAVCLLFIAVKAPRRMRSVASEEILAIRGVGLQITTRNFLGRVVSTQFLDLSLVRALAIHEAYFRHRAVFVLVAVIENQNALTLLFPEFLPRLAVLRPILCGLRAVLYNEREQGPTLSEVVTEAALAASARAQQPQGMAAGHHQRSSSTAIAPTATSSNGGSALGQSTRH